jgi:hypothetical protein
LDGGRTWGKDRVIATQDEGWVLDFDQIYRSNGLPFLVADHSRGKYKNRLYLLWGESLPGIGGEIKLKYTDNGGDSWSDEITVNSSSVGDQFLPHIAIDQIDGTVYVVFYDRRNSASNLLMDVYVAFSEDGGQTFTNKLITPQPFLPPGKEVFFGDYNGISAHRGIVRPIWTATDESLQGKLMIQTALLNKDLLKSKNQTLADTILYKFYQTANENMFVIYSSKMVEYSLKIKVKKNKFSLFGKTYKKHGVIKPQDIDKTIILKGGKGKKVDYRMKLKGKGFEVNYSSK